MYSNEELVDRMYTFQKIFEETKTLFKFEDMSIDKMVKVLSRVVKLNAG